MCPESGRISPKQSLRMVLLPEPAIPSTALVSPFFRSKETPSSTGRPSKPNTTSSKMMGLSTVSGGWKCSEAMGSSTKLQHELREDDIHGQNEDGCHHDGLGGGASHALSAAARAHAVVTPDRGDDETEEKRLDQTRHHVVIRQLL